MVRALDSGDVKRLPPTPPSLVPQELRRALLIRTAKLNPQCVGDGTALAIKDALRSGDLYLPQSKQHVSFGFDAQ